MVFFVLLEEEDWICEEGDDAFFPAALLAFISLDGLLDLALEVLLSTLLASLESDGLIGARYVSKTVLRV